MVTRKITKAVARWFCGSDEPLKLGSTDTYRDWGYADDYVKAMHSMMQLDKADDYVIATGEVHTVQEFLDEACAVAKVTPLIELDNRFVRTGEIKIHKGDYQKARNAFGFRPKVEFKELVKRMVVHDIYEEAKRNGLLVFTKGPNKEISHAAKKQL